MGPQPKLEKGGRICNRVAGRATTASVECWFVSLWLSLINQYSCPVSCFLQQSLEPKNSYFLVFGAILETKEQPAAFYVFALLHRVYVHCGARSRRWLLAKENRRTMPVPPGHSECLLAERRPNNIYIYICIYVYAYICVCIYVCIYIYMYIYIYHMISNEPN